MRVAVIGGGFSGLISAYLLEKDNVSVTVFEKKKRLGGHCQTIFNGDINIELGTVFSFPQHIKELLIELKIEYTEKFTHRNFVDGNYERIEHIHQKDIGQLIEELSILDRLFDEFQKELEPIDYGAVPDELKMSFGEFLKQKNLKTIGKVIAPYFSSFGFGCVEDISTYYAFKIFTAETIRSFMRNEKLLFVNKGMSEIIHRLNENISDVRYGIEVNGIKSIDNKIQIETVYGSEVFDKVLITTKLEDHVIKDKYLNAAMRQIKTNPYMTCAFEVEGRNIATTYFNENFGKKGRIHFFHTFKDFKKTIIVGYAYGSASSEVVEGIKRELERTGIKVKRLIAVEQWQMFPHVDFNQADGAFYECIKKKAPESSVYFVGSLISKPSISNLYASIVNTIPKIIC